MTLPPTFTEETERLFDEAFTPNVGYGIHCTEHEDLATVYEIKSFLLSRTQEAYELGRNENTNLAVINGASYKKGLEQGRAETLKEVREMCEGMKQDETPVHMTARGGPASARYFNAALNEIIHRLTQ